MKTALSIILLGLIAVGFTYTKKYPQDYFQSPVKKELRLSGTFGELRPNHFHAGIDIKGYVGLPIYAIAEGYISRIKVQSGGYGQVLYMDHPNGYTSVYAHLDKFPKEIEEYIRQEQYRLEKFELDLDHLPDDLFTFSQGEKIGEMGLTGSTFGPHLHFEIRNTKSEFPINPLLFGLKVADTRPPRMHQLKVYELNDEMEVTKTQTFSLTKSSAGGYRTSPALIKVRANRIGLGIKVYDHMNNVNNWNGIYTIAVAEEDSLIYQYEMETFSFDETRYINAHLDYKERVTKKSYFNRCFLLPGNQLSSTYKKLINQGIISVDADPKELNISASDIAGNEEFLKIKVQQYGEPIKKATPSHNYILIHNEANLIDSEDLWLFMDPGTLYENLYLNYVNANDGSSNIYSKVHHIGDYKTPVHKFFDLGIPITKDLSEEKMEKAFIAYCDKNNNITNCGGKWIDGRLKTKVRDLGDYYIMVDETPPTITPISFSSNMKGYSKMKFKITDNFRTAKNVRGLKFDAWVDGEWILMEYDGKKNLIFHEFDGRIPSGQHELRLIVTDAVGNQRIYKRSFSN